MSCLRIRLPQPKKVWKSFTSKLQTRLHKSKTIKKTNPQTAVSKTTRPSLCLCKKRRRVLPFGYQLYYVSKTKAAPAPVYIDQLFRGPSLTQLVGSIPQQQISEKNGKLVDQATADDRAGTRKQRDGIMCESRLIGLASPILNEIDARAEEFIASFRAEMDRQELIARNL